MERQKTQAVFLVDTCSPPAENLSRYCRSLCLVCTRILLFLSQFPNKEHQGRVQWNYKFFNSRKPETSVRTQTAQFYENRSELLQKFFGQLQSSLEHTQNQSSSLNLSWPQPPVKLVYSALAAAVQDFTWDAPEITSPIRRPSALSKRTKRGRKSGVNDNHTTKNVIFICSMCPRSKDELCNFLYGSHKQSDDSKVMLRSELLPPALLLQLEERGITVHWVDTHVQCACGKNDGGLSLMSNVLKTAGGTLIPISTLVNPTCSQLIQQAVGDISPPPEARKCEHQSEPADLSSSPTSSNTLAQVECIVEAGDDGMDVVPPEVCVHHGSAQQSNKDESVGSSSQSAPSKKSAEHSKSSFLLQELLSSLIFPPSTHLREYLQLHAGSSSLKQTLPTPLALQDNLFWLCTNAGKILCILDLSPMHTFPATQVTHHTTKPSKGSDKLSLHCPPPTHSAQEEEKQSNRHKLKKEHSFSRIVPGSWVSNAGEESIATSDCPQSDDRPTSASDETDCTSGGSRKDADKPSLNDVSSVPYMETLGLMKQSDLPLTWLSSATVYSCVGLYVPRELRCNHLSLKSSNRITAARAPDGGCEVDTSVCMQDSINDKGEQPLTDYRESVLTDVCPVTPSKAVYTSSTDNLSLLTSPSYQQAMHVSPQIHLRRCPVTPPNHTKIKSPKGKSPLFCPELRRSPRLNTLKLREKENTGEIVPYQQPSDSEHQVSSYTPPRTFRRLASTSPKYPVIQLRDILSNRTSTQPVTTNHQLRSDDSYVVSFPLSLIPRAPTGDKVSCSTPSPHKHLPSDSLALYGHFHSRQYQNLCLWLARNGLLLLLNISPQSPAPEVCRHLAVLQPITSLVATLSLIKPQYHAKLIGKLKNPSSFNHPSATTSTRKSKNHRRKSVQSADTREDKLKATERLLTPDVTGTTCSRRDTGKVHEEARLHGEARGSESDDFPLTKTTSDSRSHAVAPVTVPKGASHLEDNCAHRTKDKFITCYATDPELYVSLQLLFTHNRTDGHHSRSSCTSSLRPALLHSLMEGSPFTHLPLLPWFPYLHSCGVTQQTILELQQMHQESAEDGLLRRVQLDTALKALYTSSEGLSAEGDRVEGGVRGDTMDIAEPSAHAQVKDKGPVSQSAGGHSDGVGMAARPESVTELFEWFDSGYQEQVGLSSDDDSLQTWAHKAMSRLQEHFTVLAPKEDEEPIGQRLWRELNAKVLLSSGQLQKKYETLSCEEGEGKERRIREYQLQVFLHFEAMRVCGDISFDTSAMADQLVCLLRRISLLANPGIMGHCVKEVILPSYIGCCRAVLTEVYEGLMLPLPPELYCSPATNPTLDSSDSDETPLRSLQEPLAPKMVTANAKSLVRHTSFQAQKQIAVKKQKKTKHLKSVDSKVPIRFSPRLAMLSERKTSQSGRGVCRSLFNRSQSVSFEMGSKQKKEREEDGKQASKRKRALQRYRTHSDIIVKETPIKKQVDNYRRFKLQRLRSKSQVGNSPGVMTIEESPRRSFYSAPKAGLSKPHFKTPPPPLRNKHLSPKVILKKEPSPAALHSLLHGEIISPTQAEPNRSGTAFLPENPIVDESPDLFEARETSFVPGLSGSRAARMLTYDTEDPLRVQPKCTLSEPDLIVENESASMMAFALCTPTKEDPMDFCDAFL